MFNKAGIVDTIFTLWAAFHEGFHSWRSLKSALFSLNTDRIIFEAEIPAGAEVAFGRDGDIVSTELIVKPYCYIPVKVFGMTFFRRIKYHQK